MAAFAFFLAMYPLDFVGLTPLAALAVLFAAMILLPLFQACFAAFSILFLRLFAKKAVFRFPCALPLFFALLLTVFFHMQNYTWMGVPWAAPAIGLTAFPIAIGTASLFGSSFLAFLIFFINALLGDALAAWRCAAKKESVTALVLAAVLLAANFSFGAICLWRERTPSAELKITLLQANAPSTGKYDLEDVKAECRQLAREAAQKDAPDIMVWSETLWGYSMHLGGQEKYFSSIAKETNAIQIVGSYSSLRDENGESKYYNALFLFTPDGAMSEEEYYKRRPVPFGEYLPWAGLFKILIPALTEINMLSRDVDAGDGSNLFHISEGSLGGLICFDSIYPALARESVKDGANALILSTNDSWFDGSFGKDLHMAHAVLRAVENGRDVARIGVTGISGFIRANGTAEGCLLPDTCGYTTQTVNLYEDNTLYTYIGDAFVYVSFAFLILYPSVLSIIKCYKKGKKSHG